MGTRNPPPLDPPSGRLRQRVSHVKLETLNAFYRHSRSFAHHKPYIKNDQREKISNPVLIVFR
ncbi:Histone h2a [Daphnia magna]|uniref:Histone h2a n=1 Tax=Daphnia magna TaxID=35525 RepID=A0A162RWJ5_9CRUS|nr:Histone h2a [Daphnia magna]